MSVTVPSQTKKTYDQKCREKEEADQNVNRNANTNNTRQIEKVRECNKMQLFNVSFCQKRKSPFTVTAEYFSLELYFSC